MADHDIDEERIQEIIDEREAERGKTQEISSLRGYREIVITVGSIIAILSFIFFLATSIVVLVHVDRISDNKEYISSLEERLSNAEAQITKMTQAEENGLQMENRLANAEERIAKAEESVENCVIYIADNEIINEDEISHNCPFDVKRIK